MKTTDKELKKLLKKFSARDIIRLHCDSKINLTSKQLDIVIDLKNRVI